MNGEPKAFSQFKDTKDLLEVYKADPSLALANRIAVLLIPYIRKISRVYYPAHMWQRSSLDLEELVNSLYIVAVKAISRSIEHPVPTAYVLSMIKSMCRHIIKSESRRPHGLTSCWNADLDTMSVNFIDECALGLVWQQTLASEEAYETVYSAITCLPKTLRQIAILHFLEGYSQTEIARKSSLTKSTVSVHIKTAKKVIASNLQGKLPLDLNLRSKEALKTECRRLRATGMSLQFLEEKTGLTSGRLHALLYR